jgi:hypothetical protein
MLINRFRIDYQKMANKFIAFGEIMLRLATPDYLRFSQTTQYSATFGGSEANVAFRLPTTVFRLNL